MLTRREFLCSGAGAVVFLRGDARYEYEIRELKRVGALQRMRDAAANSPGSGIGAVAGSVVAYRLGLTRIDPEKHGLYFERFLNPDQTDPPEIRVAQQADLWVDSDPEWGRALVRDLRPRTVEDLATILAITRRPPLSMGLTHEYLRRRVYPVRIHLPMLRETHGVWVWQEQVMRAGIELAGFTAGEADVFRRVVGMKLARPPKCGRDAFVGGAERRGVAEAEEIYDEILYHGALTASKAHCLAWAELATRSDRWSM